jgi:hypothetical protein
MAQQRTSGGMRDAASNLGMKALAVAVLLVAAWFLFKVVLGVVTAVAWFALVIGAVIAVIWALGKLL